MSDTPRTDRAWEETAKMDVGDAECFLRKFAESLEREIDGATRKSKLAGPTDGGPAFPTQNGCRSDEGMSLRDWFAGQALSGLLDHYGFGEIEKDARDGFVYSIADAMIEARKGGAVMSRVPDNVVDDLITMLERLVDNDSGCFGGNYKWNRLREEAKSLIEKAKGEKP